MPSKVDAYAADDGSLHRSKWEAERHEVKTDLCDMLYPAFMDDSNSVNCVVDKMLEKFTIKRKAIE